MYNLGQYKLTYKPYGNHAILVEWPAKIDENILNDILEYKNTIINNYPKEKVEVISAYNSLTIVYYPTIDKIYNEFSVLKALYREQNTQKNREFILWKIPVCYDDKFGIDLDKLSEKNGLSKDQIISLHSAPQYTVFFIGFLPGFFCTSADYLINSIFRVE